MASYATRSLAADVAKRRSIECFRTDVQDDGTWLYQEVNITSSFKQAVRFAAKKDYVHHVELHDGEPILIVTCLKEELATEKVPYRVLPLTPSLWDSHAREIRSVSGTKASVSGIRERTSVPGATMLCRKIFDENPGKSKEECMKLCETAGIHPSTASTQYYRWKKANQK